MTCMHTTPKRYRCELISLFVLLCVLMLGFVEALAQNLEQGSSRMQVLDSGLRGVLRLAVAAWAPGRLGGGLVNSASSACMHTYIYAHKFA